MVDNWNGWGQMIYGWNGFNFELMVQNGEIIWKLTWCWLSVYSYLKGWFYHMHILSCLTIKNLHARLNKSYNQIWHTNRPCNQTNSK